MYLINTDELCYEWNSIDENKDDYVTLGLTPYDLKLLSGSYIHIVRDVDLGITDAHFKIGLTYISFRGCNRDEAKEALKYIPNYISLGDTLAPEMTIYRGVDIGLALQKGAEYESTMKGKGYTATLIIPYSITDLILDDDVREFIGMIMNHGAYGYDYNISQVNPHSNTHPIITYMGSKLMLVKLDYNRIYRSIELRIANTSISSAKSVCKASMNPIFNILQNNKLKLLTETVRLLRSWSKSD